MTLVNCLQRVKATAEVKKELQRQLAEWIKDDKTVKEILIQTQDYMKKNNISEHEVVIMVSCSENVLMVAHRLPEICCGYLILVAGRPPWLPRNLKTLFIIFVKIPLLGARTCACAT